MDRKESEMFRFGLGVAGVIKWSRNILQHSHHGLKEPNSTYRHQSGQNFSWFFQVLNYTSVPPFFIKHGELRKVVSSHLQ
jgi:hypothetical protein